MPFVQTSPNRPIPAGQPPANVAPSPPSTPAEPVQSWRISTASTLAIAGTPGSFNGSIPPNLAALQAMGALGNTAAWTTGQYVVLGDASNAYWDGTAWVAGIAP